MTTWVKRGTKTFAALTPVMLLASLAIANEGVPLSQLELHDGSVWITSQSEMKLGRYNTQIDELDGGLVANSGKFDVLQDGDDVIVVEPTEAAVVDTAEVAADIQIPLPPESEVEMAGGMVAVHNAGDGQAWLTPFSDFPGLQPGEANPDIEFTPGTRSVLAHTGVLLTVGEDGSTQRHRVDDYGELDSKETGSIGHDASGEWDEVTAVGEQIVGMRDGQIFVPGGAVDIGPQDAVLQQPGPEADEVLVALPDRLISIPLSGTEFETVTTAGRGNPAAPVVTEKCFHAAWASGNDNYVVHCDDDADISPTTLSDVAAGDDLVFRVNRSLVVLNDVRSGRLWIPQEDVESREPNWDDIVPEEEPEQDDDTEGDPGEESLRAECSEESPNPQANDDEFGVRPGRSRILPVIDNDTTSDCGILAISEFDDVPESFGQLEPVHGGRALQFTPAADAQGSVDFTYTITDGRGSSTPSTATVRLTMRDGEENSAPVQERIGTLDVEQGAEARYNILADFSDPDGDDLFISDAYSTSSGSVRFRNDGQLTYIADGDDLGRSEVRVVISDGQDQVEGKLNVDIQAEDSVPPLVDPLHETAYVDEEITIEPLKSVRSGRLEDLDLANVEEPSGTTVNADLDAGTFSFSASQPGTYYVSYTVVDMPQQGVGLARIDVEEKDEEERGPRAVRDTALLPPDGEVTIEPLANDVDPMRGVMVLQSVDVPEESGLRVGVVDHKYLEITATRALEEPVVFSYVVSNGAGEAEGEVTVLPVPASETQHAPVVPDVTVSVRTGGVVTIPALEDAYDPDGDQLTLDTDLAEDVPSGEGLLFVSGDLLRYQAPEEPITTHAVFSVSDSNGNTTSAQLTVEVHESDEETKEPPSPEDLTARVFAGDKVRVPVPLTGIDRDGDGLVLLGQADAPEKGRIVDSGADWLEYEAFPGESGEDTLTYAVEDWVGQRSVAEVRVGIAERPTSAATVIAHDDEITVRPGKQVEVRVLGNDINAAGGDLVLSSDLEHEPDIDARTNDSRIIVDVPESEGVWQIVYEATNERGGRDTAVLSVTVDKDAPVLPPVARDVVVPASDTIDRSEIDVDVLEVAENPSGSRQDLDVSVPDSASDVATVTADQKVKVTLGEETRTIPYLLENTSPDADDASAYAFITVPALGDYPPMERPKAPRLTVVAGEELIIPVAEQIKVAPGKKPQITSSESVSATKSDGSDLMEDYETLRFQAPESYAGPASISFEVTDGDRNDDDAERRSFTLPITVHSAQDHPPDFSPSTIEVSPGEEPRRIDLDAFTAAPSKDPEEDSGFTYEIDGDVPTGFSANIEDNRLLVSTDVDVPRGTTGSIDVEIDYGGPETTTGTVPLRVVASSRALARVQDHDNITGVEGQETSVPVLEGAFNPFKDSDLQVLSATVETPNSGTARVAGDNVVVRPDEGFIGTMVTRFRVQDGTEDSSREVEGRVKVKVRGVPDSPSRPRVQEVRDRTVVLSWDSPNSNGETVDRYRVTSQPGGDVTECSSTTCTIDGLTNDTEYRFTVEAHNAVGWSEPSSASEKARPDTKPDRPGAPALDYGDGELTAKWNAPNSPGSPINNYTLQISPSPSSGSTVNTTSTSQKITGLKNGTQYTVRVRAENDAPDPSSWSDSAKITPAGKPNKPSVKVTSEFDGYAHNSDVKFKAKWSHPKSNGASIKEYEVVVKQGGETLKRSTVTRSSSSSQSFEYSGAKPGKTYTVEVRGKNKAGWSSWGSGKTKPYSLPDKVGGVSATAGEAGSEKISVSWSKPKDGGSSVDKYEIRRDGGKETKTRSASSSRDITFSGLEGGTEYGFQVRARNAAGWGEWSSTAKATATGPPAKPKKPSVDADSGPQDVEVEWDSVDDGGISPVNYRVHYSVDGEDQQPIDAGSDTKTTLPTIPIAPGQERELKVKVEAWHAGGSRTSSSKKVTVENPDENSQQNASGRWSSAGVGASWLRNVLEF